MPRSLRLVPIVLVLIAAVVAPSSVPFAEETRYWREDTAVSPAPELMRFNTLLADLAEQLKPALVYIRSRRPATARDKDDDGEPRRSSGSGFLIDPNGLIVTNAHVVEDTDYIQVRLADGRRFTGKVIGQDNRVDLALVRIEGASNLPTLPVGDSNRVRCNHDDQYLCGKRQTALDRSYRNQSEDSGYHGNDKARHRSYLEPDRRLDAETFDRHQRNCKEHHVYQTVKSSGSVIL